MPQQRQADDEAPESLESDDEESLVVFSEELTTIYIFGQLHKKLLMHFLKYWDCLVALVKKDGNREATIIINSEGGGSSSGLAMYDRIRSSGIFVRTVGLGNICSAAIPVFLAGNVRHLHENVLIGFHLTQPCVCEHCDRSDIERELRDCRQIDSLHRRIILANSNLTLSKLRRFEKDQVSITAEEAVKYNLAHEIIKNR